MTWTRPQSSQTSLHVENNRENLQKTKWQSDGDKKFVDKESVRSERVASTSKLPQHFTSFYSGYFNFSFNCSFHPDPQNS